MRERESDSGQSSVDKSNASYTNKWLGSSRRCILSNMLSSVDGSTAVDIGGVQIWLYDWWRDSVGHLMFLIQPSYDVTATPDNLRRWGRQVSLLLVVWCLLKPAPYAVILPEAAVST